MWLNEDAPVRKQEIAFPKPFLNTAGTLGFAPKPHAMPFLRHLSAFITNPISRHPRQPASNRACINFSGGFLLHTGLYNPGITRAIARHKRRWARAPLPVIIHLLVETAESLAQMIRKLEGLENIFAVELGLPPDFNPAELPAIMAAAGGELPVILALSPEMIPLHPDPLQSLQPAALHLITPRGTLPDTKGELITGRLYGSALMPVMVHAAQHLMTAGLPVIVDGGVYTRQQAETFLEIGAIAVGLGGVLWQVDLSALFPPE